MNEKMAASVNLQKTYLRGKLIAAVAEMAGNVTSVNLAQINELVESSEPAIRYREELRECAYGSGSVSYSADSVPSAPVE